MRTITITIIFILKMSIAVIAQNPVSDESIKETVKNLEMKEARAVLDQNIKELRTLWAEDFSVNSPANLIVHGRQEVINRIESGVIRYSSFEREIESMLVLDNIVIVMGRETVKPLSDRFEAGITLQRRYTNFWKLDDGVWQLRARHANIICGNPN